MVELQPGQLVRSLAGRDKGKHYLVLREIDDKYVFLVNGSNRPVDRPKKKNKYHLQHYNSKAEIEELIEAGKLNNHHIIKHLKELAPVTGIPEEEV